MNQLTTSRLLVCLLLTLFHTRNLHSQTTAPGLPENYHLLTPRISSSGEPVNEQAFAALAREGIKTVVSVDGAPPDLRNAERHGIRYVHLPVGYDGVPPPTIAALGKLLTETKGRILIHCHHGKHRGPAAAALACLVEGSMNKEQALASLEAAGTSHDYAGLWRDVRNFSGIPEGIVAAPLKPVTEVNPLAAAMVAIDHAFESLNNLAKTEANGGNKPTLPGLNEQSVLLVEGFREAVRHTPESLEKRAALQPRLEESLRAVENLRKTVALGDRQELQAALTDLKTDCRSCHRKFRD